MERIKGLSVEWERLGIPLTFLQVDPWLEVVREKE